MFKSREKISKKGFFGTMRINYKIDWQALGSMDGSNPRGAKKYQILDASLKVIANSGLHSLSVTEVAKECSMSKPLVLYHYESKERILEDLYFYIAKMLEYFIDSNLDEESSFEEKISSMTVSYFRWCFFNREVAQFVSLMPHIANKSLRLDRNSKSFSLATRRRWERIFLESLRYRSLETMKISVAGVVTMIQGSLNEMLHHKSWEDHQEVAQVLKFNLEHFLKVELPNFNL
jgi:AcrR family transcriptional regulator